MPANLAGLPAMSIPAGFKGGLPLGLQLLADQGREDLLFNLAKVFEKD